MFFAPQVDADERADLPQSAIDPDPQPTPARGVDAMPEPLIGRGDTSDFDVAAVPEIVVRPVDWRKAGYSLGAIVVAACVLGGAAGWWSANDVGDAAQPEVAESAPLPPVDEEPAHEVLPIASAPMREATATRTLDPAPATASRTLNKRPRPSSPTAMAEVEPQDSKPVPTVTETAGDEAPAASTAAATMPLPSRVIARTIDRIGYSCGSVVSTSPVESAAPGVYKITCSSGQSFQAKPVNGRYRFRRTGGR